MDLTKNLLKIKQKQIFKKSLESSESSERKYRILSEDQSNKKSKELINSKETYPVLIANFTETIEDFVLIENFEKNYKRFKKDREFILDISSPLDDYLVCWDFYPQCKQYPRQNVKAVIKILGKLEFFTLDYEPAINIRAKSSWMVSNSIKMTFLGLHNISTSHNVDLISEEFFKWEEKGLSYIFVFFFLIFMTFLYKYIIKIAEDDLTTYVDGKIINRRGNVIQLKIREKRSRRKSRFKKDLQTWATRKISTDFPE